MIEDNQPSYVRELFWLARYYKAHGHNNEYQAILETLNLDPDSFLVSKTTPTTDESAA